MTVGQGVDVREVGSVAEVREIEALFVSIWRTSADQPPVNSDILRALAHTGCYVAGAYEGDRLLGASAGFLGGSNGDLHLHSHITGVAPDAQGRAVGRTLKLHQRSWCLERAIDVVTWTYDPLVRRNAWFNLQRLGADVVEFQRDFYGDMTDGLNAGDHSDRCLVRWYLQDARAREPLAAEGEVALAAGDLGEPVVFAACGSTRRCAVPADFDALRRDHPDLARVWRSAFRETFAAALDDGLRVAGMTAAGEYLLRSPS